MSAPSRVITALDRLAAASPRGERRPPQERMAEAVGAAIDSEEHLLVQAGTGTGKSWAYLVPAILSGRRVLVATATKALQDQLADKDLPFLREHLGHEFDFAVLKGRSNYVCRQRVREVSDPVQASLDGLAERASPGEIEALAMWAASSDTGDRAELPVEPSFTAWAAVSVSSEECPGASRCPSGDVCFAEAARRRAGEAEVTVVNLHLLGLDVATAGAILPDRDLIVIDEAHQLEDVVSDTVGFELSGGRLRNLARSIGSILDDPALVDEIEGAGVLLVERMAEHLGRRLRTHLDPDLENALVILRERLDRAAAALRAIPDDVAGDAGTRADRARQLTSSLQADVLAATDVPDGSVGWIEGTEADPRLRVAPIDVADVLREGLWEGTTTVLTSATLPPGLEDRLGLEPGTFERIDVGSPFRYEDDSLLYCATHLPDPRRPDFDDRVHDELEELIRAAGGRTLALFTSYRAMDAAVEAMRERLDLPVLSQRDLPKPALVDAFRDDPSANLFATMGFWQGIDVPGPTLSLVTIDRLPFPRPDDPLLAARRERARGEAFARIDLPRASTMLAQGAGRLIRTTDDRGVVAVFDPRLATARSYRWELLRALPPFRRTKDRDQVLTFLRSLDEADREGVAVGSAAGSAVASDQ